MFLLPKHSDNMTHGKKEKDADKKEKVAVDRWDVTRYVVRRPTKEVDGKQYFKVPKVQRLVTSQRLRRKRLYRESRVSHAKKSNEAYNVYLSQLKGMREVRRQRSASGT